MNRNYADISGREYNGDVAYDAYMRYIISPVIEVISGWTIPFRDDKSEVLRQFVSLAVVIYHTEFSNKPREDVLSVASLALCEMVNRKRLIGRRGFRTYISRVIRNTLIKHYGAAKKYKDMQPIIDPTSAEDLYGTVDGARAAEARVFLQELEPYESNFVGRNTRFVGLEQEVIEYVDTMLKLGEEPDEDYVKDCIGYEDASRLAFFCSYVRVLRRTAKWNLRHM